MKALTLHQPWASLIAAGVKTIETRSWATKYRGAIAIHAGAHVDHLAAGDLDEHLHKAGMCFTDWQGTARHHSDGLATGVRGAVVATAELVDCVPMVQFLSRCPGHEPNPPWTPYTGPKPPMPCLAINSDTSILRLYRPGSDPSYSEVTDQLPLGDFSPGRWAWLLDDIQRCDPIPAKGRQGLWDIDDLVLGTGHDPRGRP